jgi:lysophospholipase L1-like esterase
VSSTLFLLSLFLPQGLELPFGLRLSIYQFGQLLEKDRSPKKDMSDFLAMARETDSLLEVQQDIQNSFFPEDSLADDTIHFEDAIAANQMLNTRPDTSLLRLPARYCIQYPGGDSSLFFPLFQLLDSLTVRRQLIRALHLGDSQIEGDRITSYLRERFQRQFGGCGLGLVPITEPFDSRTNLVIRPGRNWQKYYLYGTPEPGPHNRYGLLHSYFRYQVYQAADSQQLDSLNPQQEQKSVRHGLVNYRLLKRGFPKAQQYEQFTVLTAPRKASSQLTVRIGKESKTHQLTSSDSLNLTVIRPDKPSSTIDVQWVGKTSPDAYGVCFDCSTGVAFDNVPLRGSSGTELTKFNQAFLKEQLQSLNVKLVILQFGVNVVPTQAASYSFYEQLFYKELMALRKADPDLKLLVVSLTDMAKKVDGRFQSYPNIPLIKEAQRNAAFKAGVPFWDLYEAMGGQNSMYSWAHAEPSLAAKDYTHFSPKGAQIVGEMLYKAIMREYIRYKMEQKRNKPA